jgi:hypothetical protein
MTTLHLGEEMTREEFLRRQRLEAARRSHWLEVDRADLEPWRFNVLVHKQTGNRYRIYRGLVDALHSPVTAYARVGEKAGVTTDVLLLEPVT